MTVEAIITLKMQMELSLHFKEIIDRATTIYYLGVNGFRGFRSNTTKCHVKLFSSITEKPTTAIHVVINVYGVANSLHYPLIQLNFQRESLVRVPLFMFLSRVSALTFCSTRIK